jgi:hypothetical protein
MTKNFPEICISVGHGLGFFKLNVQKPLLAGFFELDQQVQFNCCQQGETGIMLLS